MNIDDQFIGIITDIPHPKPLSYYLNSPRLEELLGSNFGKIQSQYGLQELLSFTANSYWTNRDGRNEIKFSDSRLVEVITALENTEKLALMKAIIEHLED